MFASVAVIADPRATVIANAGRPVVANTRQAVVTNLGLAGSRHLTGRGGALRRDTAHPGFALAAHPGAAVVTDARRTMVADLRCTGRGHLARRRRRRVVARAVVTHTRCTVVAHLGCAGSRDLARLRRRRLGRAVVTHPRGTVITHLRCTGSRHLTRLHDRLAFGRAVIAHLRRPRSRHLARLHRGLLRRAVVADLGGAVVTHLRGARRRRLRAAIGGEGRGLGQQQAGREDGEGESFTRDSFRAQARSRALTPPSGHLGTAISPRVPRGSVPALPSGLSRWLWERGVRLRLSTGLEALPCARRLLGWGSDRSPW